MARRPIAGARALLTGASSGIGRALAVALVREGANVLAVARRAERLHALAAELAHAPGRIETLAGDVTQPETRTAALTQVRAAFGGLDLLVNNAGMGAMGPFVAAPPERLRQIMELNFFAVAELTREAI